MFSITLKKALVVASVALTLPVLGAGAAYADGGNAHSNKAVGQAAGQSNGKGNDKAASTETVSAPTSNGTKTSSETDMSGSSTNPDGTFQGKGSSTPDQDGTGMDRGLVDGGVGDDKTGPGTDGNNGCGNEPRLAAPRDGGRPTDDDNNGWCGSKPKPEHKVASAAAPVKHVTAPVAINGSTVAPARVTPVSAVVTQAPARTTTLAATPAAPAVAAPAKVIALGHVTPLAAATAGQAAFIGPVAGSGSGAGSVVAAASLGSKAAPAALPFTGAPVGLLLVLAGLAIGLGGLSTFAGARQLA